MAIRPYTILKHFKPKLWIGYAHCMNITFVLLANQKLKKEKNHRKGESLSPLPSRTHHTKPDIAARVVGAVVVAIRTTAVTRKVVPTTAA